MNAKSQRGVALVITLIMVAIITLLAVSFLALSRRDQASISISQSDTVSKLAAEAAAVHAQAEVLARIISASNNFAAYSSFIGYSNYLDSAPGVLVSTNIDIAGVPGNRLSSVQMLRNLASLQMDARPPVFIKHPAPAGGFTTEERYSLDFNRNGTNDSPGWNPLTNNYYAGDPEWIGVLEHPEFPHSGTNRFVSRYAYLVLPAGNCLDLNYIHNYAAGVLGSGNAAMTADAFSRNQGVGGWEVNLGAFLQDLAPDFYPAPGTGLGYSYTVNGSPNGLPSATTVTTRGLPFLQAVGLLKFRYNNSFNPNNLASVNLNPLFNNKLVGQIFVGDLIDSYSINPVLTAPFRNTNDVDQPNSPWAGSPAPSRFVDMQDLFTKLTTTTGLPNLTNVLWRAGRSVQPASSPDDRYLFYRLLSQLSTGSEPELKGKINLNFTNDPSLNTSQTAFNSWAATNFFRLAGQAILQANMVVTNNGVVYPFNGGLYNGLTNAFVGTALNTLGMSVSTNFGVTNIEIFPNNQYTPLVHQLLQVAANLYDSACTNRLYPRDASGLAYPTVFRPILARDRGRIYIRDWVEVGDTPTDYNTVSLLMKPAYNGFYNPDPVSLAPASLNLPGTFINGVPWIFGAKKGFPNFNELAIATTVFAERKLQLKRPQPFQGAPNVTNQMYLLSITNTYGVEAWNSYTNAYPLGHTLVMTVSMQSSLMLTNAAGTVVWPVNHLPYTTNFAITTNITSWRGGTFVLPIQASVALLTNSVYTPQPAGSSTVSITPYNSAVAPFNNSLRDGFPPLRLYLVMTNSLRYAVEDIDGPAGVARLIDYVTFTNLSAFIDIAGALAGTTASLPGNTGGGSIYGQYWLTNQVGVSPLSPSQGVLNQMLSSVGSSSPPDNADPNWAKEVAGFVQFVNGHDSGAETSKETPFVPYRLVVNTINYEVNDPLVHYLLADISDPTVTNSLSFPSPASVVAPPLGSIGRVNLHYRPWGITAAQTNIALMDPGVFSSDSWDFPTNKFPSVGWIGRVHRGTPWQTIYLKSGAALPNDWLRWGGNLFTHPTNDWKLVDLFTAALNDNAASGLLPVNQQGLAAWSAVLSGVIALTNVAGANGSVALQPLVVQPASVSNPGNPGLSPVAQIVASINATRAAQPGGSFQSVGQLLQAPGLSSASPFINAAGALNSYTSNQIDDEAYERLPRQILGLIRLGQPRFVIYSYGQSLKPADGSFMLNSGLLAQLPANLSGAAYNVSTNYQITGESAYRTVFRLEGNPTRPNVVIESYTPLAPE